MIARALALTDRFLPPGVDDPDVLRRIRAGIAIGWMGILFSAGTSALYWLQGSPISGIATLPIALGLAFVGPATRRGIPFDAMAHALTGLTWAATFVVAWRTGGFSSPAVVWAFIHPVTMYIAGGRKAAAVWSALSAAQLAILFGLDQSGTAFAHDMSRGETEAVRLIGYLIVIAANVGVLGGNEAIRQAGEKAKAAAERMVERQRILGDMHDGIGGQLLGLIVQARARTLDDARLLQGLESCLDDLRLIVDSLDPLDRPFEVSLAELRERVGARCEAAGVELRWSTEGAVAPLPVEPEQGLQLLRALQETFTNALRHSGADRVDFALRGPSPATGGALEAEVRDHGRGFDPATAAAVAAAGGGGRGLTSLRTRAHRLGGELRIEAAEPGTRVTLRFVPRAGGGRL